MRRGLIFSIAAWCGVGAFGWSLIRVPPNPDFREAFSGRPPQGPGGDWPHTLPELERYIRTRRPGQAKYEAWFELAELRRNAGDLGGEREAWAHVHALAALQTVNAPDELRAWFMRAWAADKLGEEETTEAYERAESAYAGAMNNADNWRYWHRLGWCRMKLGKRAEAADAWTRAVGILERRVPGRPGLAIHLARDLALLGRTSDALDTLERSAAEQDPATLEHDECLESIRHEPRFVAIVRAARNARNTTSGT